MKTTDGTGRRPLFESRIVCYAGILLLGGYLFLLAGEMAHGYTLFGSRNLAVRDFAVFWGAGRLAAAGHAAAVYDWMRIHDLLVGALGAPSSDAVTTFYYPPWFLLVLAPLGSLPLATAAAFWLVACIAGYLAAMRAVLLGGTALIAALAAPTVLYNCFTGQDGLLTAALFAGALALLGSAPIAAGILIGLIAYKPHFGVLLPFFLAITGRWRVFAAATATVFALAAAAAALFGADVILAFVRAVPTAGDAYLAHGRLTGQDWEQLASLYGLLHSLGGEGAPVWGVHIAVAAAAAAAAMRLAASGARADLKAAGIATAAVIVTPYSELNDLAILTVPLAFLVRDGLMQGGLQRAEWSALAAAFLAPLLYILSFPTAWSGRGHFTWLVGPLICAILAVVIGARAVADPSSGLRRRGAAAPLASPRPVG